MGISEYSWYRDQQTEPLGSNLCVSGNAGQEGVGHTRQEATGAAGRDLRGHPDETLSLAGEETKAQGGFITSPRQ